MVVVVQFVAGDIAEGEDLAGFGDDCVGASTSEGRRVTEEFMLYVVGFITDMMPGERCEGEDELSSDAVVAAMRDGIAKMARRKVPKRVMAGLSFFS